MSATVVGAKQVLTGPGSSNDSPIKKAAIGCL